LFDTVFKGASLPLRAACFHPRFGSLPWIEDVDLKNRIWEKLAQDIFAIISSASPPASSVPVFLCKLTTLDDVRHELARLRMAMERDHDALIQAYNEDEIQRFWMDSAREASNGLLVNAARFFMCIQASSAASERLWSSATFTANRRPQLGPANFEATIVLHSCLKMKRNRDELFQALMKLGAEETTKPTAHWNTNTGEKQQLTRKRITRRVSKPCFRTLSHRLSMEIHSTARRKTVIGVDTVVIVGGGQEGSTTRWVLSPSVGD